MLKFIWQASIVWQASKGYRLRPWRSPYLRWRIETYSGLHADRITARGFFRFSWERRRDLLRFLNWGAQMPPKPRETRSDYPL